MPVNEPRWANPTEKSVLNKAWKLLGWTKVNFDGACKRNPGPSSVKFVARDWNGKLLKFGVKHLYDWTYNAAEAQAALMQ